jgi:Terminase large subunit, T4likevirus-type, N-terminal/Terminase RNaseH-like domain
MTETVQQPIFTNMKTYLGNPNLKRSGVQVEWTPELMREWMKCAQDVIYFTEKYVKVIHVDRGLVPLILYDYQREMLLSMTNNRYTIVTTARQSGKSTTIVAAMLHYIIFNADKTVALLANKGETAREILGRVQLAYQHLPKWLQQGVTEWNKGSFALENNSRVIAAATSSDAIRGYSISQLFIDEAAFIDNWDVFFTSVYPTVSSGTTTKVCLVSTPNGLNHFYKLWVGAMEKRNEYNPILVTWERVPGRDAEWARKTLAAMGGDTEKFAQEYNASFMGSSGTLIAGWKLKELVHQEPLTKRMGLYQYETPRPKHSYVMSCDVSHGKGLDYSAFHVIDVTKMPYRQVCAFRDNMTTPADYCEIINRVSKMYNEATVLVETNDIGQQVADSLYNDFECETLVYTENAGRQGKRISSGFGSAVDRGLRTTKTVKSIGCSLLKLLIEQNQLIINDFNTIEELGTFSKKNASYEAEPGCHDDLVMGLVLFSWMSDQQYFKELTDINTLMRLRDKSEDEMMEDLTPFGYIVDGLPPEETMEREVIDAPESEWMKL